MTSEKIHVRSTSNRSADVEEEFLLFESSTTRRVLRANIVRNHDDPEATIRVTIVHQRRSAAQEWEDYPTWSLSKVKAGEEVKLELGCEETKLLYQTLTKLRKIDEEMGGIPWGTEELVVGTPDEVLLADPGRAQILRALMAERQPQALWEALQRNAPEDLLRSLTLGRLQEERRKALDKFEEMLSKELGESEWQQFFQSNEWIFGYGLRYQFLRNTQSQPIYAGANVAGTGGQRGDYLMASEAEVGFTVLVEIKKPTTSLFSANHYRNGVWQLGRDFVGAVSQVQANCQSWQRSSENVENVRQLDEERIYTREPKGILVVGHTREFGEQATDHHNKRNTFESFRRNLHNPDIITFDELLARARFIVEHGTASVHSSSEAADDASSEDDDLPF